MPTRWIHRLRNHWHAPLILPLVVIVMTWPTFARIFDKDEFWLHSRNTDDSVQMIWDAWHLGRVFAGHSELFYTDAMFHPRGLSLAFHASSTPHSLLLLALGQFIPALDAYNLLYLLTLCFNAFTVYLLIDCLLKDKWIALYGAVVVGVQVWFTDSFAIPHLAMIGTLPLSLYFLHRSVMEDRWRFAALAGMSAGVTAFISPYTFLFLLISVAIYAIYLSFSRWRKPRFWLRILLLLGICAAVSAVRFEPMLAEDALLEEAQSRYAQWRPGRDVLDYLVHSRNPLTGAFLHAIFGIESQEAHKLAYLGYLNIFLLACAVYHKPARRRLAPWLALLTAFAILRLGDYLVLNGRAFTNIILPEYVISNLFPSTFGQVGGSQYYQIGVVTPLAVLSCFGLSVLLRTRRRPVRIAFVLLAATLLCLEYYLPHVGYTFEEEKTAYLDWLKAENESPVNVINLPQGGANPAYYMYTQSLSGYPTAFGWANRSRQSVRSYTDGNYILRTWRNHEPAICLPLQNSREYLNALDELLQEGFSHIVLHQWRPFDADLSPSFANLQPAYDDGYVRVYRLGDLRQNCAPPPLPTAINRFTHATWVLPGNGSAIISYHPSDSIDSETLAYLGLLFSDWDSLLHLYRNDGEWMIQSARPSDADGEQSAQNRRTIHLIYDESHGTPPLPENIEFRDDFNLCRRETYEDGAVIELWLNPRFSCALVESSDSPRVEYDNGALLQHMLHEFKQDIFDLQILWRNLPDKTHSLSIQFFDAAGDKAHGQDFVIGRRAITRHIVDLSSLPPGDYLVKLIFYRYSTGQSVPGTVDSSSGARFDRELKFATIRKS